MVVWFAPSSVGTQPAWCAQRRYRVFRLSAVHGAVVKLKEDYMGKSAKKKTSA